MKMKTIRAFSACLVGSLAILNIQPAIAASDPSLFLFGQELEFCASNNTKFCSEELKEKGFSSNDKTSPIYKITDDSISRLSEFPWTEQPELKLQAIALLNAVKPKIEGEVLSERMFVRQLRRVSFDYQGTKLKGRDIWSNLFEFEKQNFFDLLEQKQASKSAKRYKTRVDIDATENDAAVIAFQEFYLAAKKVAGKKRKPRVVFVTGSDRDPYKDVDYLKAVFENQGFDANWLPVDAAMQTALSAKAYDPTACESLEQFQVKKLASYRRKVLYPDLYKEQVTACQKNSFLDTLMTADALFIADGSPLLTYHAFYTPTGEASEILTKLQDMLTNKQIILGIEGNSINAINNQATIFSGQGLQVLLDQDVRLGSGLDACTLGVDCISMEAERNLGFLDSGILNLFPWGIVDNQMSSLTRHPRLMKAAAHSGTRFAFGLDTKTSVSIAIEQRDKGDIVNFKVLGQGGFWILDMPENSGETSVESSLKTNKMTTYYLTHQDQAVLKNNAITVDFASWKYSNQSNDNNPTVTSSQPFTRDNYFKLNQMLCNTSALNAQGKGELQGIDYVLSLQKNSASTSRIGVMELDNQAKNICSFSGVTSQIKPILK